MIKKIFLILSLILASNISFCQKFELIKPDTALLKEQMEKRNYTQSLGYLYLEKYYNINSKKSSVEYYEWDKKEICAFNQNFRKITYSRWQCKEAGGITETIIFPKIELKEIKKLINILFYVPENRWVTPLKYEPDGAGCYYEIKESANETVLVIYCGC